MLKKRRERSDLIQIYKLVHGIDKVNWCDNNKILRSYQIQDGRRHCYQISRERITGNEPRNNFLSQSNDNALEKPCQRNCSRIMS